MFYVLLDLIDLFLLSNFEEDIHRIRNSEAYIFCSRILTYTFIVNIILQHVKS